MNDFCGLNIIESTAMVESYQYRFPRSKKKRIRKKWSKRPTNFKSRPRKDFLDYGNKIICHPVMARRLRNELVAQNIAKSAT